MIHKLFIVISFIIIFIISCSTPDKSIGWTLLHPSTRPPALYHSGFAYDTSSKEAIIFGGLANDGFSDATWIWNGRDWQQAKPPISPSAREKTAMAYDESRDRIVLFGGSQQNASFNDTWEWNGYHWEWMNPTNSPPARCCHALAYDNVQNKVLLYGGWNQLTGEFFNDTWAWDGKDWTELSCCDSPNASAHTLVNFSARNEIFAFNSVDNYGTWVWNGEVWYNSNAKLPPVRQDGRLVYDTVYDRAVLFGGIFEGEDLNDTRVFDGETWTLINFPISPPARSGHVMFYDSARESVIVFGGFGAKGLLMDTWQLYLPKDLLDLTDESSD